jgi:hypothetical protein
MKTVITDSLHCKVYQIIPSSLTTALLAFTLVGISFWLQGNIGIGLADEGFLWHGTLATIDGNVPLRDFRSYDPGRYYWGAACSFILGDGIIALRLSTAIFQAIGLLCGLLALRRVIHSWWGLVSAGVLLLIWMHPRWKLFESSLAMMAVYFAIILLEQPTFKRHFIAGFFVGISAFFGRNHGLYTSISFCLLIGFIWLKIGKDGFFKHFVIWNIGVVVGYSPMLFMFIGLPDFFDLFIQSIIGMLQSKSTNLPLPVPWPWKVNISHTSPLTAIQFISTGVFFLLLPAFYIFSSIYTLLIHHKELRRKSVIIASVFIGAPYMHHAFSRADINHLAQAIHPFLIGLLSLPFFCKQVYMKKVGAGFLIVVYILSSLSIAMVSPYYRKFSAPANSFVQREIHGDMLWLHKYTANLIHTVREIVASKVHPDEGVLIAPHWPGFYPILQKKSPLWDTYFLWMASKADQEQQILDVETNNVNWIVLGDVALDGREDLRFRNTHTFLWQYIMEHFEPVQVHGLPKKYHLLKRKTIITN